MKRFRKIYIEITNICNLHCAFCGNNQRDKQEMQISDFEKIIKKVTAYTDLIFLHVKGEPLLHSKLEKLFAIVNETSLSVNLTTNAVYLSSMQEMLVKQSSLRQINISLHVLMQNEIDIDKYLCEVIKASQFIYENSKIIISFRLWERDKNNPLYTHILRILQKELGLTQENSKNYVMINERMFINFDDVFKWPDLDDEIIGNQGLCQGLRDHIAILVNGAVVPCCLDGEGIITLGNIFHSDLESILNSQRARKMLDGFRNRQICETLCSKCNYRLRFK